MKSGYIYVLTHPSDPNLYKIGVTVLEPKKRLAQHNRDFAQYAGRVVKETGQEWELKGYHAVPDPYRAERAFWKLSKFADIPYLGGVEVMRMSWEEVQQNLEAAKNVCLPSEQPPTPLPDHIYAYTASMKKRLEGRGITLLGHVKSMVSGKATFICDNGHQWKTRSMLVAEGEGCPHCGMGQRTAEDIIKTIGAGVICLLTHPEKPGFVKIGIELGTWAEVCEKWPWGDWEYHRYRHIEELGLAETLIWQLLGQPLPYKPEPIQLDLKVAEEAFRKLHGALQEEIAFGERRKENIENRNLK